MGMRFQIGDRVWVEGSIVDSRGGWATVHYTDPHTLTYYVGFQDDGRERWVFNTQVYHESVGVKYDDGKPRPGLILSDMADAFKQLVDLAEAGAIKHGATNWKQVPNAQARYTEALGRHTLEYYAGECHAAEGGRATLAAIAWNALALLQLEFEV